MSPTSELGVSNSRYVPYILCALKLHVEASTRHHECVDNPRDTTNQMELRAHHKCFLLTFDSLHTYQMSAPTPSPAYIDLHVYLRNYQMSAPTPSPA